MLMSFVIENAYDVFIFVIDVLSSSDKLSKSKHIDIII